VSLHLSGISCRHLWCTMGWFEFKPHCLQQ
jgi:hypothetical protein